MPLPLSTQGRLAAITPPVEVPPGIDLSELPGALLGGLGGAGASALNEGAKATIPLYGALSRFGGISDWKELAARGIVGLAGVLLVIGGVAVVAGDVGISRLGQEARKVLRISKIGGGS